jgi:hypothetical protein
VNALLLTACLLSADAGGAAPAAAPAPAPAATTGTGCGGGCGPTCASSCDKASLLDRLRARFASSNSCGCEKAPACGCEKAPKCKPACGTPLFSKPVFHGCTTSCKDTGCGDACDKPGLLDRLKAKFASRKHSSCDCAPACGGCGAAAPAGCSLPPAPTAPGSAPAAPAAPKTMPAPAPEKRTSSLIVPSIVTPAAGAIPAPMPTPVVGKSPF